MSSVKVFICPKSAIKTASATYLTPQSVSYRYRSGYTEADVNTDVAIVRDMVANHTRFGNILYGAGHVKGWSGATWLVNSNF